MIKLLIRNKIILTVLLLTLIILTGCAKDYIKITAVQGKEMIDNGNVIIVDVREQYEYDEEHIEGALLLPLGEIESNVEKIIPDRQAVIIIYCRSGRRSADAAKKFVNLGYQNIYDMGGIIDWINKGYDTVKY